MIAMNSYRKNMQRIMLNLFSQWCLTPSQQLRLLGNHRRKFHLTAQNRLRISYLLHIHACLGNLYPLNPDVRSSWIRRKNDDLDYETPLQIMLSSGLEGIKRVSFHLDGRLLR